MAARDAARMKEELRPDSLSWAGERAAGIDEALQMAMQLEDRPVIDVNGEHLGHITKCYHDEGRLSECELTLDRSARTILNTDKSTLPLDPEDVVNVDAEAVHLGKAAEQLVHPEDPRPAHAGRDEGGADNKPKKVR